jgi:CcmB protein
MTGNPQDAKRSTDSQTSGNYLKAVTAVVWKDLQAEFRSRELFSAMLVFSLLIILIFNFALELDIKTRQSVTAGVLWDLRLRRHAGTQPFDVHRKRSRLSRWSPARASGSLGNLLWKVHQQLDLHADCRNNRSASV